MEKTYFMPTSKYKKYLLLEVISKNDNLTQRDIAALVGISLSMVHQYLNDYEEDGYINKEYISKRVVKYSLTNKGIEYMRVLNIGYLSEAQSLYNKAKEDIYIFLNRMIDKGYKDIILYGAGEVAEIILQTINSDKTIPLNVISLIDDDINKQGTYLINTNINSIDYINEVNHDCVMISSYTNHDVIMKKLLDKNYDLERIEYFFK